MTNQQHPITPPPELVEQWYEDGPGDQRELVEYVATEAARWGADQELEACCEFLDDNELCDPNFHKDLRAARRPKPPSLKEQALAKTKSILNDLRRALLIEAREALELNRRALEQLDD